MTTYASGTTIGENGCSPAGMSPLAGMGCIEELAEGMCGESGKTPAGLAPA
ncbi:hypothetical protein [Burkholderia sp. 22313]|uniref:hypothetical protein n=1 Tax=Burkholderia sp. 22313 TaxID=3453908 RepID=UPI002C7DA8F2|nr:hypothetical protein [Burkholderia sp.]